MLVPNADGPDVTHEMEWGGDIAPEAVAPSPFAWTVRGAWDGRTDSLALPTNPTIIPRTGASGVARIGRLRDQAAGIQTEKVAPDPGPALSAHARPRMACASARATASPIPEPPRARDRDGSTR